MAFLFKSKTKQPGGLPAATRSITSSDGPQPPPSSNASSLKDGDKQRIAQQPPVSLNSSMIARGATPDQAALQQQADLRNAPRNLTSPPQRPPPDMSLYPWSQRRVEYASPQQSPFPRYGAAANSVASPRGDVYLMGGLINGSMVKGDLWLVEAGPGPCTCSQVATMAEGPGPRVGHASLLVGNAFIVFGGDTKIDEMDVLDDTLYLLNTSTRHWSRALPAGPRPAGRYGHTLNILSSKIFIFGGQVEGYFFNDLVAFDLNALQQASNRWETLIHNTNDGGPPQGQSPPARTNHTVITWNDKLFLFGGTDGVHWFNDVWTYDPRTNSWAMQECIGFIPAAREGHAAALVGDVMYVFGGRTEEGKDLGDLAAFRIPTRRWYTFQNMGPSPSPRSGHSMTAHGQQIYVLGGEPSSAPRDPSELSLTYVLDTSKIKYPTDQPSQPAINGQRAPGSRRPSNLERSGTPQEQRSVSREGVYQNGPSKFHRDGSQDSITDPHQQLSSQSRPLESNFLGPGVTSGPLGTRPPRGSPAPPPSGPPPGGPPPGLPGQQQGQLPRVNGVNRPFAGPDGRESPRLNQRLDRNPVQDKFSPQGSGRASPAVKDANVSREAPAPQAALVSRQVSPPRSPPEPESYTAVNPYGQNTLAAQRKNSNGSRSNSFRSKKQQSSFDMTNSEDFRTPMEQQEKPLAVPGQFPMDSGVGSSPSAPTQQTSELQKELDGVKSQNVWYATELAQARKAGYGPTSPDNTSLESRNIDAEDKPIIDALTRMRNEVLHVQEALSKHQSNAAEKIAQIEKQRDAAVSEAIYARTRYAARVGKERGLDESSDLTGPSHDRSQDSSRRLATALAIQDDLQTRIQSLASELESERKARQLAEESADVAHGRASELDKHKQESVGELERLRIELHDAQMTARREAANHSDILGSSRLLQADKNELHRKLSSLEKDTENHDNILSSLRNAVTASTEKATLLEQKLEGERRERDSLEDKLSQLKTEHESRVAELDLTSKRLEDAEEMAATYAAEARSHREVVLSGFGKTRDREDRDVIAQDERVSILQERLEAATATVKKHQEAADHASERLRRAEERIAGLEQYQEQTSREGLSMRKQLQAASKEAVALRSEKAELQQQLTSEKMDATAIQVQHGALKDLLSERGIDPSSLSRNRPSEDGSTLSAERFKELEQQLDASVKAHEEMRASFEQRELDANRGWEEKIAALDNDYQAAVKYLKGTENYLEKMKRELHKYKAQNKDLEEKLAREKKSSAERSAGDTPPPSWEQERISLHRELESMQSRVQQTTSDLERQMQEVRDAKIERDELQQQLANMREQSRADVSSLRTENTALEERAAEAEHKVQSLLEQVGNTVNNYRRESQQMASSGLNVPADRIGHRRGVSSTSIGGESNYSLGTVAAQNDGTAESETGMSRNSMALDHLASELETLRSHWETTNKNYRSSGQSMLERTPMTPTAASMPPMGGSSGDQENLASWRKKLELDEERERSSSGSRGAATRA